MLERARFEEIITDLSARSGDNEEVMNLLAEIKTDYDERSAEPRYGEADVIDSTDNRRWDDKYRESVERYRNRFFNTVEGAKDDQREDVEKDSESAEKTFDELFKSREGE